MSESMRFLQHSPLHNRVDALLHVVDVHGRNKIKIDIDVPLRKGIGLAKVSGTAVLNNANLVIRGVELNVDAVNGLLAFDEAGIEGKGLQALVLNEAVTIDLLRGKKGLLLKAKGWAGIAELSKQFPLPIWPYLEGKAAYDLSLTIPMNGGKNLSTLLKLRSDTKGIALNLPAPYGKSVNEKRAFSMSLPLKAGNKTKMALRYADDVRVGLLFTAPGEKPFKLLKGEIRLDGRKPLLPEKGLRLAGALSHFDVAPWVMLEKNGPAIKESDRGKDELLQELALKFEQLVWGERRFNHVGFNLKRARASWEGAITSQFGGGFMQLPDDLSGHSPLVLKFDRLNVPDGEPEVDNRSTKAKQETFNPAELPNLNISAKRLILKGENLGALQLVTERIAHGVRIKQLMIESDKDQLKSSGEWVSSANGENKTAFNGTLESKDLGNLIKRLGITQALKSEDDKVSFSLSWKGSPWDMQVNSINGQFGLALGKGRLVDVELGAGRLLGLLSLQTIQRRLTLDFSDLFAKGLSFDDVKAHYKVVSGDAWTDDFFLDGPVARIDIQGRMGLAKRDYDQTVVVTPKTTENLPLASALVGGPVVGAAVFVAQKLIGDRVEKVTRSRYSLAGSWDRPELTLLGQNKPWMEQILDRVWTGLSGQDAVIEGGAK